MSERTITDQIRQLGPTLIEEKYYLPGSHPFAKPATVKYLGYLYPQYKGPPEAHFGLCQEALGGFVANVKASFPDATVKTDKQEIKAFNEGIIWDESNTNPLFENIKGKIRFLFQLASLVPVLRPISERLSWVLLREQHNFTENMNWISGLQGWFDPQDERLLVLDQKGLGRVTLSVTPHRCYQRFFGGVAVFIPEPGIRYFGTEPLPILVRIPNKQLPDGATPFERIIAINSGPLRRVFPSDFDLNPDNHRLRR